MEVCFESLDRISGREGKSKLLAVQSDLYRCLKAVKAEIRASGLSPCRDRMDLHIEVTTSRDDDSTLRAKAEALQGQLVDVTNPASYGILGGAFVLWTPAVQDYGRTHVTLAFFGKPDLPDAQTLREIAIRAVATYLDQPLTDDD